MIRLLGISGSLRQGSYNTALLRAAAASAGSDVDLTVVTLHGIPLYDGDLEAQGIPHAVTALKDLIAASDGVIIATPEYNGSVPGVLKNALDWLSRPPADMARVFGNRPLALAGASPGGFGTVLAQNAWLPVLKALGVRQWTGGRLLVSRANKSIGEDGAISGAELNMQIREFVVGFAAFVGGQ